jgi:signal transduction histidine kinase
MRSLRARFAIWLVLPLLLASGLAFALSGLLSVQRLDAEFPAAKERQLRFYAGLIAEPMWNLDLRTVEALLGLMLEDADAVAVELRDEGGHLVARAGADSIPENGRRFERVVSYSGPHVDRVIGRIMLAARNAQAADAIVAEATRFALVAGFVVAIALAAAYVALSRLVLRPLDAFRRAIADGGSAGRPQPVLWQSNDEFGEMTRAYNELAEQLDRHAQELAAANADLARHTVELGAAREIAERRSHDAEAASRAKSEFLASMSHELRTPLNAVIGFADIMHSELHGPVGNRHYRGYVDDILSSGRHLLSLINDVLDMAKVEAGKHQLANERIEISAAVAECRRIVAAIAEQAGVELRTAGTEAMIIEADARALKQVLLNLLSNAIKFTPAGGKVTVTAEALGGRCIVAVRDTGRGIAANDVERVLRPFEQVESVLVRRHTGTGLGLPLSKALVELHGGNLRIDSVPGQGTEVRFDLPLAKPEALLTSAA